MTKFNQLKKGEVLSEAQFYVVSKVVGNEVELENELGDPIIVNRDYVEKCLIAADQFDKEQTVNRTEAIEIFSKNPDVAMTVNFNKKVDEKDVTQEIIKAVQSTAIGGIEPAVKTAVKKAINGEERTMIGRHSGSQDGFGRYNFVDMELPKNDASKRKRLVDPRTINWLIVRGVKYKVK